MKIVYLSLGSNIGDREAMLQGAVDRLHTPELRIARISPVYETAPQYRFDQRWFLNAVVEAHTELFPMQLLGRTAKVEFALGRKRFGANGPRSLDIDIILYAHAVIRSARLEIPHPRYPERRFVLAPLADLAPDLRDPVTRRTVKEMLGATADQNVRVVEFALNRPA